MTTTERKRMSTKTTFKRIALVAVAALGLGVLSVAPSSAAIDETLTVSASTASVSQSDTATVTVTNAWTSTVASDSRAIVVTGSASGITPLLVASTDSANITVPSTSYVVGTESAAAPGETITASTLGGYTKGVWSLNFKASATATAGTYVFNVITLSNGVFQKSASVTLTVSKKDVTASELKSLMYISDTQTVGINQTEGDSALVVSAGTAATPAPVAIVSNILKNAADTKTVLGTSVGATESIVVTMSGPGYLQVNSKGKAGSSLSKSATFGLGETITVFSDGTAGVATLTGSIAGRYLTQAAKTITFVGKATAITATVESSIVVSGSTAKNALSFTAKDSASNVVKSLALNANSNFFVLFSDTKVVGGTSATAVDAAATPAYYACTSSYQATYAKFTCDVPVTDSGTATVYIGDSYTVASSSVISAALKITVAGAAYKGTIAADKTNYVAGEKAIITVTSKDRNGSAVANGASAPFTNLKWDNLNPIFGSGGDATNDLITLLGTGSFVDGVDTYVVYMPSVAGTYVLKGMTSGETVTASALLTFTVTDPTKDAADAATDAALEATDAAYAAQDAAQLAAESADAATAAAEAATAAAEAATAAVEDLATKVAGLFADLQKQITTLANVVAKIAKKVKA